MNTPWIASAGDSVMVPLERIITDAGSQTRVKVREALVRDYAGAMKEQSVEGGLRFPPVILFLEGGNYWLADGFHRVFAARRAGLTEIAAFVHPGNRRDAILFGISANCAQGLPRTSADKRKAVQLLLADQEWSQWSDREIAKRCQVVHSFVGRMRRSASGLGVQIARKVERGGTVYEMNVDPRETSAANPAADPPPSAPAPAADEVGIPLPEPMVKVFAAQGDFQEADDLLMRLAVVLDRIAQAPAGDLLRPDLIHTAAEGKVFFACAQVRMLRSNLTAAKPYCSRCPNCHRTHPVRAYPNCKICGGRGWTTRPAFERCGQFERQEILKLRP